MDSDDDDIFCYTPVFRNRSLSQDTSRPIKIDPVRYTASQQVASKSKLKKPTKRPASSPFKTPTSAPKKKKMAVKKEYINLETEVCPICQMPWIALGACGRRTVHTNKCSAIDYSKKNVCPKGQDCQVYDDEKHYFNYGHSEWAKARARLWEQGMNDVTDTSERRSHNEDSGYEDAAVAGPSGWKPKIETKREAIVLEDSDDFYNSSHSSSHKTDHSVILFDIADDDSLPDLSTSCTQIPDIDFDAIPKSEVRDVEDDQNTVIFPSGSTKNSGKDDDQNTVIFSPRRMQNAVNDDDQYTVNFPPKHTQNSSNDDDQNTVIFSSRHAQNSTNDDDQNTVIFPARHAQNSTNDDDQNTVIFPARHAQNSTNDDDQSTVIFPARHAQNSTNDDDQNTVIFPASHAQNSTNDDDQNTVIFPARHAQNLAIDDDQATVVYPPCVRTSGPLNDIEVDNDHTVLFEKHLPSAVSEGSVNSSDTDFFDKRVNGAVAADVRSGVTSGKGTHETNNGNSAAVTSSSGESESLLRNQEHISFPAVATVIPQRPSASDRPADEPAAWKQPIEDDDELGAEEYEVLNRLVDEAVDKYVGQAQMNSKCFHLHLHYNESKESSSPQKNKGRHNSILNYFKPKNAQTSPEDKNSTAASSCCSQCCQTADEQNTRERNKSGNGWKTLMSKMQTNAKKNTSTNQDKAQPDKPPNQRSNFYGGGGTRSCPFYKYIPDTSIVVDAFSYGYLNGIDGYFLSHFHYDHYGGLTKKFNKLIYCSHITAKLVSVRLGVPLQYLRALPMDEPRVICDVEVTLLDANHCPGSVMFLFKLRTGSTVLHVGDFRANPKMESYPALWNCNIDTLYLDTTYCRPNYDFPSQEEVLDKCVSIAMKHVNDNSKTLIVVGSYTIGKERVFRAIADVLDCRIWASSDKQRTLRCIEDEDINSRLTSDKLSARIHVVPMKDIHPMKLGDYVNSLKHKYNEVVAMRPTGWEHSGDQEGCLTNITPKKCGNVYIYGIPYSEHSSYNELRRFVKFTRPSKIIPTVNVGNPASRKSMEQEFRDWLK